MPTMTSIPSAGPMSAKSRGWKSGRPRFVSGTDISVARALLADPDITAAETTEHLGTNAATLYRYLPEGGRSAVAEHAPA